jgi:anhydro-N-acetylmuramic acid kinase
MAGTSAGLYLGLISGTSADGIDAALVRFEPGLTPVATHTFPYPDALRARLVGLARQRSALALDELGQLDIATGVCFANAALALLHHADTDPSRVVAIGSHGQTVCHHPHGPYPFTLQLGNANVVAERTGIVTIADFRGADVAAGGQGAPLLPALHAALLADVSAARAIVNLGGIANLTLLIPGEPVRGFDTGPANCLMDAWSARLRGLPHDEGGAWAATGRPDASLLDRLLDEPYFQAPLPKSSGREVFNLDWLDARLPAGLAPEDVQATLLHLSAATISNALRASAPDVRALYACGGGVHNQVLMDALHAALPGVEVATTAALGLDPDFVEAIGFAWLARGRIEGLPGNLPSVTGARGPRVLGGVYAPFGNRR